MQKKILIMGLPGAGKTTLAKELAPLLNAVLFNADAVRSNINVDLGFSTADRIEQSRRMGWLCDRVSETGRYVIADFICPTSETRKAFGDAFIIWVDRVKSGRFADTNLLFAAPENYDLRVTPEGSPRYWAEQAMQRLRKVFDPSKPTAMLIGRYQPFHEGHRQLIEKALDSVDQVCIGVRCAPKIDAKNPLSYQQVKQRIDSALAKFEGRFVVKALPNITNVMYGRDVGYQITKIEVERETEVISATKIREEMNLKY